MTTLGNHRRSGWVDALLAALWIMLPAPAAWCAPAPAVATDASVLLYFADGEGRALKPERFSLPAHGDATEAGRAIVAALIDGPKDPSLTPVLPAGGTIKAFYVTPDKTAVVDLSMAQTDHSSGGIMNEALSVFAIVNTLVLNNPDIEQVRLLIDGQAVDTYAGHIDLESPLKANLLLIR